MRLFLSAEDIDDPLAGRMLEAVRRTNWNVEHSPRNPVRGDDVRWTDWYGRGCKEALARADVFLGVVTPGWDGSTWMGHEGETALDAGVPLFLWNPRRVAIPLGMRRYAERTLDAEISVAIAQLDAYRAAPLPPLERHLARLFRFIRRLPGCPEWSGVLIAENLALPGGLENLGPAPAYSDRFSELLGTCSWVNLQAAGIMQGDLVVSVEASSQRHIAEGSASVQLSGPEAEVAANAGWALGSAAGVPSSN